MEIESMNSYETSPMISQSAPWVQKYRPHQLNDLISHQSILNTRNQKYILNNNIPNLLFYGPPGTGKTSTIIALAREIYKQDYKSMVLQLNASDQRGINVVRQAIKGFAGSGTLSKNRNLKLVILDQADMMTNTAQFALRRIIQKYHSNARFCLISNYVSKIIPALQSRCTRFKFKQIPFQQAKNRIFKICDSEKLQISHSGIQAVFKLSQGDMRRVVNMLQSLSMMSTSAQISQQIVYDFTGNPSPKLLGQILDILLNSQIDESMLRLTNMFKQMGIALETVLKQLYQMVILRIMPNEQKAFLMNRFGDIQYRLSIGCQERICLASLIGAFMQIRHVK